MKNIELIGMGDFKDHGKNSVSSKKGGNPRSADGRIMAPPPFDCQAPPMKRPISISEAAEILGISAVAVTKRISRGTLLAVPLSDKGIMVCRESVLGEKADPKAFKKLCSRYISVPEACDIVCVTDGMIGRMLADGRLRGFRLNPKAWAVEKSSCDENIREYLASPPSYGRPRVIGAPRRPAKKPKRKRA
jgi:hypothetical protein